TALEQSILRLYGPGATGQVSPDNLASLSSQELSAHLAGQPTAVAGEEIDRLIERPTGSSSLHWTTIRLCQAPARCASF
ncbi:MAG: hypothetical protein KDH08_18865, partial [Anaerolineae bacterium]|nr:hypothetical protein [Anaerolineae bacterium]